MEGFTLVELMVVVAIFAILVAIAGPDLKAARRASHLASAVNGFAGVLNAARGEAARLGVRVTMCKSSNGSSCVTTGDWAQGWIMFADVNNNAARDTGEAILKKRPAEPDYSISGNGSMANYISYMPMGMTRTTSNAFQSGTITICDNRYPSPTGEGRQVVVNASGRAHITSSTGVCP